MTGMPLLDCPCGGVILADTECWNVPLCNECYTEIETAKPDVLTQFRKLDEDYCHQLMANQELQEKVDALTRECDNKQRVIEEWRETAHKLSQRLANELKKQADK